MNNIQKRYEIYDKDGTLVCKVDNWKHLPDEWLPENKRRGGRKKKKKGPKSTNSSKAFVYKTSEITQKKCGWITWDDQTVGSEFWLGDPRTHTIKSKLCVVEWIDIDPSVLAVFDQTFKSESRKVCAAAFLGLSEHLRDIFCELPIDRVIKYLKVPIKWHAQFRKPGFGSQQLEKYAKHIASTDKRREQEKLKKEEQADKRFQKRLAKVKAERYGESDLELGGPLVRYTTQCAYVVDNRRQNDCFDSSRMFWDIMFSWTLDGDLPCGFGEDANNKINKRYNVSVKEKLGRNDMKRVWKLLRALQIAYEKGILNKDVLKIIVEYYEAKCDRMKNQGIDIV